MFTKSYWCFPFLLLFCLFAQAESKLDEDLLNDIKKSVAINDGDILYIDFWASWCNPCRKSFPWMNSMIEKYEAQGFKILAINVDKDKNLAEQFLASVESRFPILYDPQGRFANEFKLKGMPSSFIIDSHGAVLAAHKGFFENKLAVYENEIESHLNKQP